MPLVGDKSEFAVEYDLKDAYPPYGNLRLWVAGLPLGDYSEPMHLFHALATLKAFSMRKPDAIRTICQSASELPDPKTALQNSFLSLGEAHDYYELAIWCLQQEQVFRFFWRVFPQSDSTADADDVLNEVAISWATYDAVILTVTSAIETEIHDKSGSQVSFD
jgi:hypothetical protein